MTLFEEPFTDPNKLVETGSLAQEWPFGTECSPSRPGATKATVSELDVETISETSPSQSTCGLSLGQSGWCFARLPRPGTTWSSSTSPITRPSFGFTHSRPPPRAAIVSPSGALACRRLAPGTERIVVKDNLFDVFLGEPGGPLESLRLVEGSAQAFSAGCGGRLGAWRRGRRVPGISCGGRDWITTPNTACGRGAWTQARRG